MTDSAVTPNNMPGAADSAVDPAADAVDVAPEGELTVEKQGLSPEKLADLNRTLRNEKKAAERRARELEQKATEADQRWGRLTEQLAAIFGGGADAKADFDPKNAIDELARKFETSERARVKSEVARTEDVDPDVLIGDTEEQMRESAQRYKARVEAAVEAALKAKGNPAAPPASTVTANGKITGPEQITSRDQLKRMSPQEISKAHKEGRLNELMGKS